MIENDISKFSCKGNVMIAGDLNARIAQEDDFIPLDSDKHVPLFSTYKLDARLVGRISQDTTVNSRGRQLLPLCISAGLRILNGRTTGDLLGSFTCYQPQGSSVVDYILASEDIVHNISYFYVNKLQADLSDHCQVSCMLKCNYTVCVNNSHHVLMPDKYIWDDKSPESFVEALNSSPVQLMVHNFKNKKYNKDIEDAARYFNNIIQADKSLKKKINKLKSKK